MVTRIVPWPLPTIQGQATNEGPPGGGGNVPGEITYIEVSHIDIKAGLMGTNNAGNVLINKDTDGIEFHISGLEVIDVTGLSVIEKVTWTASTHDFNQGGTIYKLEVNEGKASYSVGTNVNRTIRPAGWLRSMTTNGRPDDTCVVRNRQPAGTGTFTLKVVNSMGLVLQQYETTFDMKTMVRS